MEVDTGTNVSVISEQDYVRFIEHLPISSSNKSIKTVSGDKLLVKGQIIVKVESSKDYCEFLPLIVVKTSKYFKPLLVKIG